MSSRDFFSANSKYWLDKAGVKAALSKASVVPLLQCALLVEREAKQSMVGSGRGAQGRDTKTGRYQKRAKSPPSPKGSPPAVQTGNLRASISYSPVTPKQTVLVGPTREAWYGRIHEFGGKRHPKRPFMRPALARAKAKFPGMFAKLDLKKHYRPKKGPGDAR